MTKKELFEKLKDCPDDMVICKHYDGDYPQLQYVYEVKDLQFWDIEQQKLNKKTLWVLE